MVTVRQPYAISRETDRSSPPCGCAFRNATDPLRGHYRSTLLVMRRVAPWILSLPLMLGGAEMAHWLSYRLVYPSSSQRDAVLAQTGHSYFGAAPMIGALGGALLIMAAGCHWRSLRGGRRPLRAAPYWQFLLLPALCFALQEHLEQLLATGSASGVTIAPTFFFGVLLTLPFGLLAYLVARLLLGVVEVVVRVLGRPQAARQLPLSFPRPGLRVRSRVRGHVLASGGSERGPPSLVVASAA